MAIRFSDAAAAQIAGNTGLRKAVTGGHLVFYTGTQPASANMSISTSQPIISFTKNDGVYIPETRASAAISFANWTSGDTITAMTIAGVDILGSPSIAISYSNYGTGALAAAAFAAQINYFSGAIECSAFASSTSVVITAPIGSGSSLNNMTISATGADLTHISSGGVSGTGTTYSWSSGNGRFGSGSGGNTAGVTSVNGLTFNTPIDGATLSPAEEVYYIDKKTGETWKGRNGFGPATATETTPITGITDTTYTAGWARLYCSAGDDGTSATSGENGYVRVDFNVGTSSTGNDFVMTPSATFTVNRTSGSEIESSINNFRLKINKKMA